MATIGRGVMDETVFAFFEGMRTYDAEAAAAVFVDDAEFESPWTDKLVGREAIQAFLTQWLGDPVKRPTFSIVDVSGDGAVTRLTISVSNRFGAAPQIVRMDMLVLRSQIYHLRARAKTATFTGLFNRA